MDKKLFERRTKLLWEVVVGLFAAQGIVATLQGAGVIHLGSAFKAIYDAYKAAIPDNVLRLLNTVGISITPGSVDYILVFLIFTVPLVRSVYMLHPTKAEWEAAGRKTSWYLSFWLYAVLLLDTYFAAQNVFFSAMSADFNSYISSQTLFGLEIRFLTIGSVAALSLYRLWADLDILPEQKQLERRSVIFRTLAILGAAALIALVNRFFAL